MNTAAELDRAHATRRTELRLALFYSLSCVASLAAVLLLTLRSGLPLRERAGLALLTTLGWAALTAWCERTLRAVHPSQPHGRWAPWRHPRRGPLGRLAELLANSRLVGAVLEPVPELAMRSDIRDVVYVNYLVPTEVAEKLVPAGLALDRLGPEGRWALFTFLTYRHGHFGFRFLGPLRALLPSPVQSNWRVHVRDPARGTPGIYFVTNAISSTLLALAARLTTRGMPMHVYDRAAHARPSPERVELELEPGAGSAPDAELSLEVREAPVLEGAWAECFGDWRGFLAYCVPQDRAMATQPEWGELSRQEIDLGIPLEVCVPLGGSVRSERARSLVGDAAPLCFLVPEVRFAFDTELHEGLGG